MKQKYLIERAIICADGIEERVRIEMICPRFSDKKQRYKIKYDMVTKSIYIQDPNNAKASYRYNGIDFERLMFETKPTRAKIIILTQEELEAEKLELEQYNARMKELKTFTFKEFLGTTHTIEDVIIEYSGFNYIMTPSIPSMFDVSMKKGKSGNVILKCVNSDSKLERTVNLKDIEVLIRNGEATASKKE